MTGPELPDAAHRSQDTYQRPPDWAAPGAALVASAAAEVIPAAAELGRVHIMGIAGSGMSSLARIMLARGVPVSGCDHRDSLTVQALRAQGASISIGHSLQHLDDCDTVVYSTAIEPTNFELVAARERGLRVLRRASGLAAMITGSRAVGIAGTHGKTTTTSLLTVAAQAAGLDPSFAIGANMNASGLNGHAGTGEWFVVEADESDGSFLLLRPELALVTNVEADHLENYGDLEAIFGAFEMFVDRIVPGGLLVVCADDPGARRVAEYARSAGPQARGLRVRTYGLAEDADLRVSDIAELFDGVGFSAHGLAEQPVRMHVASLIGSHMALNAAGALGLAAELGAPLDAVRTAWRDFQGVNRRIEYRGSAGGVRVYDDYAHHPTEVRAELAAAHSIVSGPAGVPGPGRLIAVFQPGTYSRTQTFAADFGAALAVADLAVVLDIFPAREVAIPGVTGALIAEQIPLPADRVRYEPDWHAVPARVAELARPGDVVLTMGIGDVHLLCPLILAEVSRSAEAARP